MSDRPAERTYLSKLKGWVWSDLSAIALAFIAYMWFFGEWTNIVDITLRGYLFAVTLYLILRIGVFVLEGIDSIDKSPPGYTDDQ